MWPLLLAAPCLPPDLSSFLQRRDLPRPTLSGPDSQVDSADGRFRFHWTDYGRDAIPVEDLDGDGVPDIIARVEAALSLGLEVYAERGYRPLEPDNGWGGSAAVDLYFQVIDANGYAYPALPEDPEAVSSCYLQINTDLLELSTPVLESVVVHELHHCIQFAYTVETHAWLYESFATFEQYQHVESEELSLAAQVLWGVRLAEPERSLASTGSRYEYAGMIFPKYLLEKGGVDLGRMGRVWEALALNPAWREGLDRFAFEEWGGSLDGLFLDYSSWNAFACERDDGQHYAASPIGCELEVSVPIAPVEEGFLFAPEHRERSHTAAYFELENAGQSEPVAVRCGAAGLDAEAGLRLIALDREGLGGEEAVGFARGEDAELSARLEGPVDPEGSVLLVFSSTGESPATEQCTAERVAPVELSGGCSSAPGRLRWAWALSLLALLRRRE
ncbi:MAG: hypothetical protein H6741_21115 [Alphaproteobacteria bacterium]|nr:hypothetical protein [Alphaproteobacteria bacterium]